MKKILKFIIVTLSFYISSSNLCAQGIFNRIKQKAQDKVNQKIDNKTDKVMDSVLNPTTTGTTKKAAAPAEAKDPESAAVTDKQMIATYRNYDFMPGDKIILQSQLADERVGEIPSQFTLTKGQADIQEEDGENVIHVPKGPDASLSPRFAAGTVLPDAITIEFDFKNETYGVNHVNVDFGFRVGTYGPAGLTTGIGFRDNALNWTLGDIKYPDALLPNIKNPLQWHHIAIAINKNAGKAYIDQFRVANVNNLAGKHDNINIEVIGYENSFIKNIRIAAGGMDVYKKVTTESKIITHGILFDVDQATLQPQSMGTLNTIADILKRNAALKFEIDGHTDNTGSAAHNLTLSKLRADAVKTQLVNMGIDASRLTTKGFGNTKPLSANDTPEDKANNRRVEFIKM